MNAQQITPMVDMGLACEMAASALSEEAYLRAGDLDDVAEAALAASYARSYRELPETLDAIAEGVASAIPGWPELGREDLMEAAASAVKLSAAAHAKADIDLAADRFEERSQEGLTGLSRTLAAELGADRAPGFPSSWTISHPFDTGAAFIRRIGNREFESIMVFDMEGDHGAPEGQWAFVRDRFDLSSMPPGYIAEAVRSRGYGSIELYAGEFDDPDRALAEDIAVDRYFDGIAGFTACRDLPGALIALSEFGVEPTGMPGDCGGPGLEGLERECSDTAGAVDMESFEKEER